MTFCARNILILLVLAIDLFRKSCKLRSVREPTGPQFRPSALLASLSLRMAFGVSSEQ
jgi:hypothetical protein